MSRTSTRYLYRARNGVIFGVFRGLSDYTGLSLFWMRVVAVIGLVMTGFLPGIPLYLLAALLMKPEPVNRERIDPEGEELYNTYTASRTAGLQSLKRRMEGLERRTQRVESAVTAREYDWERRLG